MGGVLGLVVYMIIVVFVLTLLYRLVKAVERIADEIEGGITVKTKSPTGPQQNQP